MKAETVKTVGYLISSASVALLGAAAWPGAQRAGLTGFLVAGMAASIIGMACRWWSYEMDKRRNSGGG
jgi:predicted anti-sigma-YlaC factor YlaD